MDEWLILGMWARLNLSNIDSHLNNSHSAGGGWKKAGNVSICKISNQMGHCSCIMNATFGCLSSFHPQMSNLLLTPSVACFLGGWLGRAIFRSPSASFHSLLPLLFTSALSITLLFWGGLFSPFETPLCTQVLLRTHGAPRWAPARGKNRKRNEGLTERFC